MRVIVMVLCFGGAGVGGVQASVSLQGSFTCTEVHANNSKHHRRAVAPSCWTLLSPSGRRDVFRRMFGGGAQKQVLFLVAGFVAGASREVCGGAAGVLDRMRSVLCVLWLVVSEFVTCPPDSAPQDAAGGRRPCGYVVMPDPLFCDFVFLKR